MDVLLTRDRGIAYEQNLSALPIAVIVLRPKSGKLLDLMQLVPAVLIELGTFQPRTLIKLP